jgi:hypothetical protein
MDYNATFCQVKFDAPTDAVSEWRVYTLEASHNGLRRIDGFSVPNGTPAAHGPAPVFWMQLLVWLNHENPSLILQKNKQEDR